MSGLKRSIATEYRKILFRSKLEADWPRAFDAMGVKWEYEPKGRYFGDLFYLVDFYLPASRQWVEVKGVFEPNDVRKVAAFLQHVEPRPFTHDECPDIALIACEPSGVFRGWVRGAAKAGDNLLTLSRNACRELRAFRCGVCLGWWFADDSLSWACQCCGADKGNSHVIAEVVSSLPDFPDLYSIRSLGYFD